LDGVAGPGLSKNLLFAWPSLFVASLRQDLFPAGRQQVRQGDEGTECGSHEQRWGAMRCRQARAQQQSIRKSQSEHF
jgi:hypothetical protein